MSHPLDRPVWNMLNGPMAGLAQGGGGALRIDPRYGPFAAARDRSREAQAALAGLLGDDDDRVWLVEPEPWSAPAGLQVVRTAELLQMVAEEPAALEPGDEAAQPLGESDVAAMTALALATEPGPWGSLTHRYGQFYGLRDGERLAAMAGERMRPAAGFAEVSGVCTWPEYRGRGHAARLIRRVMAGLVERGDTPFLHSYSANAGAIALYERLGFRARRTLTVTILARA
jgi:ribosomal protein S18 acetylase RimI-like enzyme